MGAEATRDRSRTAPLGEGEAEPCGRARRGQFMEPTSIASFALPAWMTTLRALACSATGMTTVSTPSSFGTDSTGELYVVSLADGKVYRLSE